MLRFRRLTFGHAARPLEAESSELQVGHDLVGFRKAPLLQLGEHELAIDGDLEPTANGGNDRAPGDVHLFLVEDLFRQTDGFG